MQDFVQGYYNNLCERSLQDVESRTQKLMEEYNKHVQEYLTYYPEDIDKKWKIFESWSIQKLAGIQTSIEETIKMIIEIKKDIINIEIEMNNKRKRRTNKNQIKHKKPLTKR